MSFKPSTDHCVGQIRIIFQPCLSTPSPYLVYAQRFDCSHAASGANPNSGLFRLKRAVLRGGHRLGAVLPVKRIRCAVDVAPFFGDAASDELKSRISLEASTSFNLNKYSDKETFHLLRV